MKTKNMLALWKKRLVVYNYLNSRKLRKLRSAGDGMDIKKAFLFAGLYAYRIIAVSVIFIIGFTSNVKAGPSITVIGGNWDLGSQIAGSKFQTSANKWSIQGSPDGKEDIQIKVTSTGQWVPDPAGVGTSKNQFALRRDGPAGQVITNSYATFEKDFKRTDMKNFGLWFQTPPIGSEGGPHTLTVTLTATNWRDWCGGYKWSNRCWYNGGHWGHQGHCSFCDAICLHRGGCDWDGIVAHYNDCNTGGCTHCHVCHHIWGGRHCYFHYWTHCHQALAYCHYHGYCMNHHRSGGHDHCDWHSNHANHWSIRFCACKE
ncbi:MAG: hypothetical protein BWY26_00883 [Elusimicrobia bacterium ADurb.Bin231]|nr:MAG: hypothetical protein BWY26_00883 [Elusimicrobia bacterium ADurb.Bin231]